MLVIKLILVITPATHDPRAVRVQPPVHERLARHDAHVRYDGAVAEPGDAVGHLQLGLGPPPPAAVALVRGGLRLLGGEAWV